MFRTQIIDDIQSYLSDNYTGPVTILGQEDLGDISPPSAIIRITQSEDMGYNQAILWQLRIIVAVFHDADDSPILTAEFQAQEIFNLLSDFQKVNDYLESKGNLISVWRPLTVEASRSGSNWEHFCSFDLIASPLTPPDVSFEFIPTLDNGGGLIQWRGMGKGIDDNLYSIPYHKDYILITDTETDTTLSGGPDIATWPSDNSTRKWVDCVSLDDGRIIANPHQARGHLIIDTTTDPITTRAVETINGLIGYGMQVRGGAVVGDTMYSVTYDTSPGVNSVVRTIDLETERYGGNLFFDIDRTGPFYELNPSFSNGAQFGALCTDTYWGAVAGNNNKVYGIPFGQDRILIIEHSDIENDRKVYQGVDTLTGGIELETWVTPPDAYLAKYTGGAYSNVNNNIYSAPRHADAFLKIDTKTDRAYEIPLPADYLQWIVDNGYEDDSKSLGCIEGSDGKIYGTWWQVPAILWIDPRTDYIGWIDMTQYDSSDTGSTRNIYAYGQALGNSIYYSPASGETVLKMTINN